MAVVKTISANGSKGHHKFSLRVSEDSTSGNNSYISYTFTIAPVQNNYDWSGWGSSISYSVTINGTSYTGTIPSYNGTSTVTLKSGSNIEVAHETDGTKTINIAFSVTDSTGQSYTCGNASASDTMTLTTLHKAPILTSWGITEKSTALSSLTIGQKIVQNLSIVDFQIIVATYDSASLTQGKLIVGGTVLATSTTSTYNSATQKYTMVFSDVNFGNLGALNIYDHNGYNVFDITVEVKDSANATSTITNYFEVIPYTKPTIIKTNTHIKRKTDSSTTLTDNIALLNFSGTIYKGNDVVGNANSQQVQYKIWDTTEPSYTNISSTLSSGNVTITNYQLSNITYTKTYDYRIRIKDTFITSSIDVNVKTDKVPTGVSVWSEYKDRVDFLKLTVGGNEVVGNAGFGYYAKIKLTTRYIASQTAWTVTKVDFTNSSFSTSNRTVFSEDTYGIKCNFTGVVLVMKALSTSTTAQLDIVEDDSNTTEIYNTAGKNTYLNYIKTVSSGDVINLKFNSSGTSFDIYEGTQISVLRLK